MARDVAVELAATVTASPPRIALSWPTGVLHDAQIVVQRKAATAPSFVGPPKAILPAGTTTWVDTDAAPGIAYDYFVERTIAENRWQSAGFLRAGIGLPLVEDRGQIALVVEDTVQASLSAEIARLDEDLRGDGWIPVRALVQRVSSPPEVKETIAALYRAAPDRLRQVLLLGHVPVPYSGNIAPDHHYRPTGNGLTPTHQGAWPADIYYGDMVGAWTDTTVDTRNNEYPPTDPVNVNVPGDGNFDQTSATTDDKRPRGARSLAPQRRGRITLAIGRVDLSELPAFYPRREIDLLRAYLDKDHRFRHGQLVGERFAVVDDHFPIRSDAKLGRDEVPESKAVAAYSVASALFGPAAVKSGGWLDLLGGHPALFGYASGPGHHSEHRGCGDDHRPREERPEGHVQRPVGKLLRRLGAPRQLPAGPAGHQRRIGLGVGIGAVALAPACVGSDGGRVRGVDRRVRAAFLPRAHGRSVAAHVRRRASHRRRRGQGGSRCLASLDSLGGRGARLSRLPGGRSGAGRPPIDGPVARRHELRGSGPRPWRRPVPGAGGEARGDGEWLVLQREPGRDRGRAG